MSRRESRVSVSVRQNDALLEFENFKKKFLLANKHITKLNSTLSVRIEELNAQISTLYVENLRLRASEISLSAQLKREREKSRKIMTDAETATLNLTKHLSFLRESLNIIPGRASPPTSPARSPRARRPAPNTDVSSPPVPRLARAPNIPGIYEEEEACSSAELDEARDRESPSPTLRRKNKARLSASRLPLPARVASPPPIPTPAPSYVDLDRTRPGKRKQSRRQSGLLNVNTEGKSSEANIRPLSPAFGSPIRREAGLAEEEEEVAALVGEVEVDITDGLGEGSEYSRKERKEKKDKGKEREREGEKDVQRESLVEEPRRKEKKRAREVNDSSGAVEGGKSKLKDVTNSPRSREDLPTLDSITADCDQRTSEAEEPTSAISTVTSSSAASRNFLSTAVTTPATTPAPGPSHTSQLPTPRSSTSPIPPVTNSASESEISNGRESRRNRKSVNYAEPKLNTKMRKPDPPPGSATIVTKKRTSTASAAASQGDEAAPASLHVSSSNPLAATSAPSSPHSRSPLPSVPVALNAPTSAAATTVKRKKSRPYILPEEGDESEGAQADAEFNTHASARGWVNIDGRRRSVQSGARAVPGVMLRRVEDDDRRHSLAV